ncbi:YqaI family protein [Eremococcus coleocola]|uniref:YqaI family protein n=1 Tax=Eremococcus coleocola TaxID=88132 RepID=UPI00055697C6|nr:hypothetical protein [Eremococcus coleocola]
MIRDSLGVPLEPEEETPIGEDYYGDYIYDGDYIYNTPDGYVLESNVDRYIYENLGDSYQLFKQDM